MLPGGVRDKIDRACRRFIWSGASSQDKISMISWNTICELKENDNLGFKSLSMINKALHMKLAWGLISSPDRL